MERRLKRKLATLATFFVLILLFCVRVTGVHFHMVAGLIFVAVLAIHTITRRRRILKCPIRWMIADIVSMAAMLGVLVSGFMLPFFKGAMPVLIAHKLCSVILVIGIIVHIIQHTPKKEKKTKL
ncbi:MAG: hypothetical protein IJ274_16080 [Lachnospiraceae bacterium]|nr:hypothetical protein [Lachnospiraceae bacterium]